LLRPPAPAAGGNLLADATPQEVRARAGTEDLDEAFLRLIEARELREAA
jgi:ABC-2 type transport system ATP-binding protein